MTTFLLDTHAVIWAVVEPGRLGPQARRVIAEPASSLLVSAVTALELSTKHRLGKLSAGEVLVEGYERHIHRLGLTELAISTRHGLVAGSLDWAHRDPFDRLLAAQALVEGLTLVTVDPVFATLPGLPTIW